LPYLYSDNCPHCGSHPVADASLPKDYLDALPDAISAALDKLYNGGKPDELLLLTGKSFVSNVSENYTKAVNEYTARDAAMVSNLMRNTWMFSAAKNKRQIEDLERALRDKNGKKRDFSEFKRDAESICRKYNEVWMRTESNFTVAASQNAARWCEFEKDRDIFPNLKYQTVGDTSVRYEHAVLDGTVKPMNDGFWDKYYPPNGWGCRCEAVQTMEGEGITKGSVNIEIPALFKTNLAKKEMIFPETHPYYTGTKPSQLTHDILMLPPEKTFYFDEKMGFEIHPFHGKDEKLGNIECLQSALKHDPKGKFQLLPEITASNQEGRENFYTKEYLERYINKNADGTYNGRYLECKKVTGNYSAIQDNISEGREQSNFVMIVVNGSDEMRSKEAWNAANGKMSMYKEMNAKGKKIKFKLIVLAENGNLIFEEEI
jgi:SPP1 gp7 family putative phage head morphogenesis protein